VGKVDLSASTVKERSNENTVDSIISETKRLFRNVIDNGMLIIGIGQSNGLGITILLMLSVSNGRTVLGIEPTKIKPVLKRSAGEKQMQNAGDFCRWPTPHYDVLV
jgi:hypothetical protein